MTLPVWILRTPDDEREQGGLANAVGPDQPRHALGGNIEREVVERERFSVAMRYALDLGDEGAVIVEASPQARRATGFWDRCARNPGRGPRLHNTMEFIQNCGVALELDAEHQLLPLLGGLDALWRELGVCRDEADGGGNDILRDRIENDARLVAERELPATFAGR